MPDRMTGGAKRDPIRGLVAKFGKLGPRLEMVGVKASSASLAVLACPVVSVEDGLAELPVCGAGEVGCACGSRPAPPVGVRWSDQVLIGGRATSGSLDAERDSGPVFWCQRSPSQCSGDVVPLALGNHTPRRRRLSASRGADLGASRRGLRRIVGQVARGLAARVRAETFSAGRILASALLANPQSGHKPKITCC